MTVHLIYNEVKGERLFLCWSDSKKEAAWISDQRRKEMNGLFGRVAYFERELAEKRAKQLSNGKVLTINI